MKLSTKAKEAVKISTEGLINLSVSPLIPKCSWRKKCLCLPSTPPSLELSDHSLYLMVAFLILSLLALTRDLERESKPPWDNQIREGSSFIVPITFIFYLGNCIASPPWWPCKCFSYGISKIISPVPSHMSERKLLDRGITVVCFQRQKNSSITPAATPQLQCSCDDDDVN